ncbi:hypothetical protein NB037_16395, partial [Rathayibacter sp. ZW T2_19]
VSPGRPPRRRLSRTSRRAIAGGAALLLLAGGAGTAVLVRDSLSQERFAEASEGLERVAADHDRAVEAWAALEESVGEQTEAIRPVLDEAGDTSVDPSARDAYEAAIDALVDAADDVPVAARAAVVVPAAPDGADERFAAADDLDARVAELAEEAEEQEEQRDRIRPLLSATSDAATAFSESTAATAEALIASSTAATHESRWLVEKALYGYGSDPIPLDFSDPGALRAYLAQVEALQASQEEGLVERAAADWPRKQQVLDFADSIGGGVPIDISWEESIEVDGVAYGDRDSGAGLATWSLQEGAPSRIQLTESIQRYWDAGWTVGLVAHEVGHAITSKQSCYDLYRAAPFDGDDEKWATAWALSLGYTEGSGVEPYGYPGDDAIAAAAGCR